MLLSLSGIPIDSMWNRIGTRTLLLASFPQIGHI